MAAPPPTEELPVREAEKKSSTEQEINPWDVQAGQDEQGNTLQFDYVAISQYAFPRLSPTIQFNC
jgi:tryptophanyl-tRNA synthetase